MRVLIYACEQMYHGLHGIEDMTVVEVDSIKEADEYGIEMSERLIESYDTLINFDDYDDDEAYGEALLEAREWYVYPINEEKAKSFSIKELDKLVSRLGLNLFVEEYCGEIIE